MNYYLLQQKIWLQLNKNKFDNRISIYANFLWRKIFHFFPLLDYIFSLPGWTCIYFLFFVIKNTAAFLPWKTNTNADCNQFKTKDIFQNYYSRIIWVNFIGKYRWCVPLEKKGIQLKYVLNANKRKPQYTYNSDPGNQKWTLSLPVARGHLQQIAFDCRTTFY